MLGSSQLLPPTATQTAVAGLELLVFAQKLSPRADLGLLSHPNPRLVIEANWELHLPACACSEWKQEPGGKQSLCH